MDRESVLHDLLALLGARGVLHEESDLALYEYDGSIEKGRPDFVVFPQTTAQVAAIARISAREQVPLTPRGAGTGLSGGSVADQGGITVAMNRMNRILEVDPLNRRAVVQPGVVNADISAAVARYGLYYVPDPSSQRARVPRRQSRWWRNPGGPHCLRSWVTNEPHTLGLEVVRMEKSSTRTSTRPATT